MWNIEARVVFRGASKATTVNLQLPNNADHHPLTLADVSRALSAELRVGSLDGEQKARFVCNGAAAPVEMTLEDLFEKEKPKKSPSSSSLSDDVDDDKPKSLVIHVVLLVPAPSTPSSDNESSSSSSDSQTLGDDAPAAPKVVSRDIVTIQGTDGKRVMISISRPAVPLAADDDGKETDAGFDITVAELKKAVSSNAELSSPEFDSIKLLYAGKLLEDDMLLESYGLTSPKMVVNLLVRQGRDIARDCPDGRVSVEVPRASLSDSATRDHPTNNSSSNAAVSSMTICCIVCLIATTLAFSIPAIVLGDEAQKEIDEDDKDTDDPCASDLISFNLALWEMVTGIVMISLFGAQLPCLISVFQGIDSGNTNRTRVSLLAMMPLRACAVCFWCAWSIVGIILLASVSADCNDRFPSLVGFGWFLAICLLLQGCNNQGGDDKK